MRFEHITVFEREDVAKLLMELCNEKVRDLLDSDDSYKYDTTMSKVTYEVDDATDGQMFMLDYGAAFIFYGYVLQYGMLRKVRCVEIKNKRTSLMFSYEKEGDVIVPRVMPTDGIVTENDVPSYMRSIIKTYLNDILKVTKLNVNEGNDTTYLLRFIAYLQQLSRGYSFPDTDRLNSVLQTLKQVCDFDVMKKLNDVYVTLSLA